MTDFVLTDGLIRSALRPSPEIELGASADVVSVRIRSARQRRRGLALPWLPSPAGTMRELQRARLARVALAALLLAAAVGMIAAGASLIPPPAAPPQWLLVQNGQGFTVPFGGGERRTLAAFTGLNINDISTSWDGTRLATVRGARNDVLQVWDAAAVFAGRPTSPVTIALPSDLRFHDAGDWLRDGSGILLTGVEHGGGAALRPRPGHRRGLPAQPGRGGRGRLATVPQWQMGRVHRPERRRLRPLSARHGNARDRRDPRERR